MIWKSFFTFPDKLYQNCLLQHSKKAHSYVIPPDYGFYRVFGRSMWFCVRKSPKSYEILFPAIIA